MGAAIDGDNAVGACTGPSGAAQSLELCILAMTGMVGGGFYQDAEAEVTALVAAAEAVEEAAVVAEAL